MKNFLDVEKCFRRQGMRGGWVVGGFQNLVIERHFLIGLTNIRLSSDANDVHAYHAPSAASWKLVRPAVDEEYCCKSDHVRRNSCSTVVFLLHFVRIPIISGLQMHGTEQPWLFLGPFHSMIMRKRFLIEMNHASFFLFAAWKTLVARY